jgi:hypothetical protein
MPAFRFATLALLLATTLHAQTADPQQLQRRVDELQSEVQNLKSQIAEIKQLLASPKAATSATAESSVAAAANATAAPAQPVTQTLTAGDRGNLDFLRDTTINVMLDSYYAYNFNHPYNRVNLLRPYDVLSNNISLNQADLVVEHAPDVAAGRRWGARVDLQFGQATDTLQGNPANEARPQIYRNIFQAYGTYVAPIGSGLTIDVGKWASSLGIEGNYTKDQINYSRSFYFNFLPFYHEGVRANYKFNDKVAVNYWIVNGTNQTEATNAFKDELFGFVLTPKKSVSWTINYYLGQDNPDRTLTSNCGSYPLQPGLCSTPIRPAPDGRTHIFDSYVSWQATPKLSFAAEGDYFISRVWQSPTDGNSSAPSHVDGGAVYARYQLTKKVALGARGEYLSDSDGLFSGVRQDLKETTLTYDYQLADGFLMRYEWRRDFSNRPYFYSDTVNVFKKDQNTATVGLIWWFGRKEGSW